MNAHGINVSEFQSKDEDDILLLLISIHNMFWAFMLVFTACELGERVRSEFDGVRFLVDQLKWYLFPYRFRPLVPTIVANAQNPVEFKCFGSISCSRESFQTVRPYINFRTVQRSFKQVSCQLTFQVVNMGYKYFMLLRSV